MKVLFDTNVIIDALTDRNEESKYSRRLLEYVAVKRIDGYICAKQITDIYYVLRKYFDEDKRRALIKTLCKVFNILPLLSGSISYCLNSNIKDYEDAIIDETAKINAIDYLVTNNEKDFENAKAAIIRPKELFSFVRVIEENSSYSSSPTGFTIE